jgi:hypothetical protein
VCGNTSSSKGCKGTRGSRRSTPGSSASSGSTCLARPHPLHRRFLQLIATELADLAGGSPGSSSSSLLAPAVQVPYVSGGCHLDQHQAAGPPPGHNQSDRAAGNRRRPRLARPGAPRSPAGMGADQQPPGPQPAGSGAALLLDVITRIASLSDAIGCRGFYEHLIPEFERSRGMVSSPWLMNLYSLYGLMDSGHSQSSRGCSPPPSAAASIGPLRPAPECTHESLSRLVASGQGHHGQQSWGHGLGRSFRDLPPRSALASLPRRWPSGALGSIAAPLPSRAPLLPR